MLSVTETSTSTYSLVRGDPCSPGNLENVSIVIADAKQSILGLIYTPASVAMKDIPEIQLPACVEETSVQDS